MRVPVSPHPYRYQSENRNKGLASLPQGALSPPAGRQTHPNPLSSAGASADGSDSGGECATEIEKDFSPLLTPWASLPLLPAYIFSAFPSPDVPSSRSEAGRGGVSRRGGRRSGEAAPRGLRAAPVAGGWRPGPARFSPEARRMQPPALPGPGPVALLEAAEEFAKRKKTSFWFAVSLLVVSIFILTIGLAATTRTENVTVGGYYPGIILVAAIVFISFGMVAAFCCAIVDGVFAAQHIEPRPISTGRCQFYSSGIGYLYDVYQTEVTCHSSNGKCQLKVKSNTCYCCDLYNCDNTEYSPSYYEFVGVSGCQDVIHLYRLLWSSAVFNVLGLFLGIVTAAVLGTFKENVVS
ncbi:transmembrane protein 255B [Choloepus didactylus]|uniref:transmembrane protein 255B n=1 Tax=Choloepus didactylus TaxID=27675 RepID=UPI00189E0706|nr:transmembrane protein 255B [Choloepus didactylus]